MALPLIPALISLAPKLLDTVAGMLPDGKAKQEAEAKMTQILLEAGLAQEAQQSQTNTAEAQHSSLFVAGWRPFIGWTGGVCLAYAFLLRPWIVFVCALYWPDTVDKLPDVPMDAFWEIIVGMLGLGGLRTFEKIKKVSR